MSKNPEGRFYEAVERRLPVEIYKEGMANPYRGGTPDRFYEGNYADLWVEYKWYDKLPVRGFDLTSGKKPKLTALQQEWLNRRHANGHNCAVIVGFKGSKHNQKLGMVLLGGSWNERVLPESYHANSLALLADWIRSQTSTTAERATDEAKVDVLSPNKYSP